MCINVLSMKENEPKDIVAPLRVNILVEEKDHKKVKIHLLKKGWNFSEWVRAQMKKFIEKERL